MNICPDKGMGLRLVCMALLGLFAARAQSDIALANAAGADAGAEPETPPPLTCPAGAPIGAVNLRVRSPKGTETLQFQSINHLSEGDTVLYDPLLRGAEKRVGEVALVMVPAKRDPEEDLLIVTDPKPANKAQEWKIPKTIALAAFVFGPQGLSKKRVRGFLSQDDQLVAQLADYAEKTSQTEALLQALSDNASSSASMNSALNGFASQYGFAVQLDKAAPPAVQAQTLFASMNPQLASYNPLASSASQRIGQTASLATAAATLFFGSPIGLAAGGTAMLLEMHSIAFPNMQFRSSFAQPMLKQGVNLCGQRDAVPAHTRVAFVWAVRIPNTPAPAIKVGDANTIAQSLKTAVPVSVPEKEWKYVQRAREWTFENDKGEKTAVKVLKLANQQALEVDLSGVKLPPGDYRLGGFWDWEHFQASGEFHVRPLSDFKSAALDAGSQNRLLARSSKIPVTLTGSDFEFASKVELKKTGDEFAVAEPVRFLLPKGAQRGPQEQMDVLIDTASLDPGKYALLVSQQDGKSHPVEFNILPNPPRMDNLPILINQGTAVQHYVLHGERLDLLKKLEAPGAEFDLSDPAAGGNERSLTVRLKADAAPGKQSSVAVYLTDRSAPIELPEALQVTSPLPIIASTKLSLPGGTGIAILPGEFPAGYTLTAMLDVKSLEPTSTLALACAENVGAKPKLHVGEQSATSSLQQLSQDQLFLSYDTSPFPAGCTLQAKLDNGQGGKSEPATLARIIRLPQIISFQLAPQAGENKPQTEGTRNYLLTGNNLEMIEKFGWDANVGSDVASMPAALPGMGQQQSLTATLPAPPSSHAALFIWLRGEKSGRTTNIPASAANTAAR